MCVIQSLFSDDDVYEDLTGLKPSPYSPRIVEHVPEEHRHKMREVLLHMREAMLSYGVTIALDIAENSRNPRQQVRPGSVAVMPYYDGAWVHAYVPFACYDYSLRCIVVQQNCVGHLGWGHIVARTKSPTSIDPVIILTRGNPLDAAYEDAWIWNSYDIPVQFHHRW